MQEAGLLGDIQHVLGGVVRFRGLQEHVRFNWIGTASLARFSRSAAETEVRVLHDPIVWQIELQHRYKPSELGHEAKADACADERVGAGCLTVFGAEQLERCSPGRVLHLLDAQDSIIAQGGNGTDVQAPVLLITERGGLLRSTVGHGLLWRRPDLAQKGEIGRCGGCGLEQNARIRQV